MSVRVIFKSKSIQWLYVFLCSKICSVIDTINYNFVTLLQFYSYNYIIIIIVNSLHYYCHSYIIISNCINYFNYFNLIIIHYYIMLSWLPVRDAVITLLTVMTWQFLNVNSILPLAWAFLCSVACVIPESHVYPVMTSKIFLYHLQHNSKCKS